MKKNAGKSRKRISYAWSPPELKSISYK
jgi:hypothetical protein